MEHLGDNIRRRRKHLGISQRQLANNVGVTQGFISNIESGARYVTTKILQRIALALNTNIDDLFGKQDEYSQTFGEETLIELESLANTLQYKSMLQLIDLVTGAMYFGKPKHHAALLLWKAKAHNGTVDYRRAVEIGETLLHDLSIASDKFFTADVHNTIAKGYLGLEEIESAHYHATNAYDLIRHEAISDINKNLRRSILSNLGTVLTYMNRFDEAKRHLQKASELIDQDIHQNVKQHANILFTMASIEFQQQRFESALNLAKQALRHYEFIHDVVGLMETLNNIAYAYKTLHDVAQAKHYFDRVYELACAHPKFVTPGVRTGLIDEGYNM